MRNKKEGVSPVIAVILMVAITVVLAAVLYTMVIAMLPKDGDGLIMIGASKSEATDGWVINIDNGKFEVGSDTNAYVEDGTGAKAAGGVITKIGITNHTYPAGSDWEIRWNDNNEDGEMNAGDTLFIQDPGHLFTGYNFKMVKGSSSAVDIEL